MKNTQTAEQAAMRANGFFGDRCTARATDCANRVAFESPEFESRDAVGEQFTDVNRFEALLLNLEGGMRRLDKKHVR